MPHDQPLSHESRKAVTFRFRPIWAILMRAVIKTMATKHFDAVIIGAGGAGMMCAIQAGRRGRGVALLEHSPDIGRKILISGGGRCNFTNIGAGPNNYISANPDFCRSALSRFTPEDFIRMVKEHGIPFHEKKLGQLFCDRSAREIVDMLVGECAKAGVETFLSCLVQSVEKAKDRFLLRTSLGDFSSRSLVIATGGLSVPKTGASDFGFRIAQQFGLNIIATAPALDGFRFRPEEKNLFDGLAGVSADSIVSCGGVSFRENLLFTHSGLSGPAALQTSLYWHPGKPVSVNFAPSLPGKKLTEWLLKKKRQGARAEIKNLLAELLPKNLSEKLCAAWLPDHKVLSQMSDKTIEEFCRKLQSWEFIPAGTVGYQRAEVTQGGVDTNELSSKTMESKKVPGLYFIGEVVDVTGWLGGYNFQWAWSSGWAAGQAV